MKLVSRCPPSPSPIAHLGERVHYLTAWSLVLGRVHFDSSRDPYAESRRMKSGKHEVRPDLVVYATGYKQEWSWLEDGKYPKGPEQVDVRDVTSSNDTSVAFIGFVRPGVGAYFLSNLLSSASRAELSCSHPFRCDPTDC